MTSTLTPTPHDLLRAAAEAWIQTYGPPASPSAQDAHFVIAAEAAIWDLVAWPPVVDRTPRRARAAIPAAVRLAVYERDGWACVRCGATDDLALDHVFPHSLGGPDTEDNLQTLCRSCNSRKGSTVDGP